MTESEAAYEQAKINHRLALRALAIADGQQLPPTEIQRLQAQLAQASSQRREAFNRFMLE